LKQIRLPTQALNYPRPSSQTQSSLNHPKERRKTGSLRAYSRADKSTAAGSVPCVNKSLASLRARPRGLSTFYVAIFKAKPKKLSLDGQPQKALGKITNDGP